MGDVLLFGGLAIALTAQFYIVVLALRRSLIEGVLCFIVPAYILFWAKRQETRQFNVLLMWGLGVLMFIVGVAVSS
jgi:hypothetical protein